MFIKPRHSILVAAAATSLVAGMLLAPAQGAPDPRGEGSPSGVSRPDNRPGPLTARQEARRKAAQKLILSGRASADGDGVIQLADDKYYQAAVAGTGRIFTILAEFGEQGSGKLGTVPGPLHNQIQQPDRTVDNSTAWRADFSRSHFETMFFGAGESFANFYSAQSAGNYTVAGEVTDWVRVPGNASTYGDNTVEDLGGAWQFVEDSGNAWYAAQLLAGRSPADIKAQLATFDVWDRYDWDQDGNFDEADGYLDHFQAVHAGEGEEAGGGAQGADAIWSHRWYVNGTDFGTTGPTVTNDEGQPEQVAFGGTEIGDTGYWIGDYTTEPENGGLGVFAHEYGHDLGLPDLYDTSGGGENSSGFWTLMSGGSWMSHGVEDIGTTPNYMGPWEKLQLGWLDYAVVDPGVGGSFTLSPAARQVTGQEQAVVVDVPDQGVSTTYTAPFSGAQVWWTGSKDDLNTTLARSVDLTGARSGTVTAKAWYDIEAGYDYLYAEYSTNGVDWTQVGNPLDGSSNGRWSTLRYSLPGGQPLQFRFRYQTDGGVHLPGAFLDDITIKAGRTTVLFDDVEGADDNGWTAVGGFKKSTGTETTTGDRYYLLENRTYVDYDATLQVGPYIFSRQVSAPNWVDHFPYDDGLLVWAVDETYGDNNTSEHLGHGLALPLDARPAPTLWSDGTKPAPRRQMFDAAFGLQSTTAVTFRKEALVGHGPSATAQTYEASVPSRPGIATFSDADVDAFYSSADRFAGVYVAGHGVTATVNSQVTGGPMTITVNNPV